MTPLQLENKLAKTYLRFIEKLSPDVKLDIISQILLSIKRDKKPKISREDHYAGAWDSEQSADEFAESLRLGRVSYQKNIEL